MKPGSTVLVACSGGADSLALLLGLAELARPLGLRLAVAHLDHGLRADSVVAARAVERRARELELPYEGGRVRARAEMRRRGLSGEDGLRVLRREFLQAAAERLGADHVALAHTADDQAETVLLRLTRGTGLRGLGAMRWRRGRWIRPLLGATREDVREFLADRGARARRDPSNRDLRIARNRIRHRVLPELRRLNPNLSVTVAALAERARAVDRMLQKTARAALRKASGGLVRGGIRLVRSTLLGYHPIIRETVLQQAWVEVRPRATGLTRRHLQAIEAILERGAGGATVDLPHRRVARLERGLLFLGEGSRARHGTVRERSGTKRKRRT